jgi:hypothetical protein
MANVGRPPKPVEEKRRLGNPGKRALPSDALVVALPAAEVIPEPTRPLGTYGTQFWERVWQYGIHWISPSTDFEVMMMTAELIDERWGLRAKVMKSLVAEHTTSEASRDRRALRELDRLIDSHLSQLGLTPADRTRLGYAEVKRMSKIAELRKMSNE